jgi:hypothetical protein
MLEKFTSWFIDIVIRVLKSVGGVFYDIGVTILDAVLGALSSLISAVPAPSFLSEHSIGSLIGQLPSDVLFFVSQLRLAEAMGIIAAGFAFRMTRKIVTLGQW